MRGAKVDCLAIYIFLFGYALTFFGLNMSLCSILSVVDVVGVFFLLEFISVLLLGLLTVQFQVSSNVAFHYRLLNLIE